MSRFVSAALACLLLAGCGTHSDLASTTMGKALRGTTAAPTSINPADFKKPGACPPVSILPDTESMQVTEKTPATNGSSQVTAALGAGPIQESNSGLHAGKRLRWQAAIEKTARDCTPAGAKTSVRVGVAGRAVLGMSGKSGAVTLPIRIAVREGDKTTYSKLHKVQVTLTDAAPSAPFALVDDSVTVADPASATIYVGFDEKGR